MARRHLDRLLIWVISLSIVAAMCIINRDPWPETASLLVGGVLWSEVALWGWRVVRKEVGE